MAEQIDQTFYAGLVEAQAQTLGDKPYILFEDDEISFRDFNLCCTKAANALTGLDAEKGDGVALFMGNAPEYLYLFNGVPRAGLYTVPINTALKGDGLKFILTHSEVKFLVVDDVLYPRVAELGLPVGTVGQILVRRTTEDALPEGTVDLEDVMSKASDTKPELKMDAETIAYLMYTSGTTGLPKGVVYRNRSVSGVGIKWFSSTSVKPQDILYTCLPLFHANAITLTAGFAMGGGVPFGLEKKFSASRFWESIRKFKPTQFNALGAMIPILMKQPERPDDADNTVRRVNSAACPANLWVPFEKRFGVKIYEAYGAVDGGGVIISNDGSSPVGSVGKVMAGTVWKLVDDEGKEVKQGEIGELISKVRDKKTGGVEYFKNPEAMSKKVRGDWLHSGDYFYEDKDNNLFFTDRKSDSMRRRGENISSFQVENIVEKHEAVAECAAFGVPSDLGEDEVMVWVLPKKDAKLDLKELMQHCADNMAYFMVPRFVDIVDSIPRTGTLRVQKGDMKKQGVTDRTWDREKEMPELELKR